MELIGRHNSKYSELLLKSTDRENYWKGVKSYLGLYGIGSKERVEATRQLGLSDIFFFMTIILHRKDANLDFVFKCCKEIEAGYIENRLHNILHLYARGHFKSSILTHALTIRELCSDSEITTCIFSHTRDAAKKFLGQIKREFEVNSELKMLFPDVCWSDPERESPRWSLNDGIVLKRKGNPKEASIEAWGVVDRQPTGRHFDVLLYDDLVTKDSVNTPEQIEKTNEGWRLSLNLDSVTRKSIRRYIGTRWHYKDTYSVMGDVGIKMWIKPATEDGTYDGKPVLLSREQLVGKCEEMGEVVAAAQLFLNPMQVSSRGFQLSWIRYYDELGDRNSGFRDLNRYIIVDPSKGKSGGKGDYTVMLVVGLGKDMNYYLLYGLRDRINLINRQKTLFELVKRYMPISVYYEEYGMQSDIEHMNAMMDKENYRFNIIGVGGKIKKIDRIETLGPLFENGKIWFPRQCLYLGTGKDSSVVQRDFVREFIDDEYMFYPFCKHDDMLDCMARISDGTIHGMQFPFNDDCVFGEEAVTANGGVFNRTRNIINTRNSRYFGNKNNSKKGGYDDWG